MKKLLLCLLLCAPLVFAYQDKEFTWTPPTQNEDGSPLADSEIASYNIYCNSTLITNVPNTSGTDTWQSPDGAFPPGSYSCTATTVATTGEESAHSNAVNFTVDASAPNPPGNLTVNFQ